MNFPTPKRIYEVIKYKLYDLKHFIFNPANIIKCKELPRGGYNEPDELLLYASFSILVHAIEKEKLFVQFDWDYHKEVKKELDCLYEWWTSIRPVRSFHDPRRSFPEDRIPKSEFVKKDGSEFYEYNQIDNGHLEEYKKMVHSSLKFEDNCYKEDTNMLIRLCKVRQHLWT
jgi:hypothetical protein